MSSIAGFAANALQSLSSKQVAFIQSLPKAELHAHLNGSIPLSELQDLAREYTAKTEGNSSTVPSDAVHAGLTKLKNFELEELHDFFGLFPAIYALTSNPPNLARAARAVLREFLDGDNPQCTYLELRSTPRETPAMSRMDYVRTVLAEVERYPRERAALIVSVDRRMEERVAEECIQIARTLKEEGRRVVGVDLCGDPLAGDMKLLAKHFLSAKQAGLGVTLHIAETAQNTRPDTLTLLSFKPDRLGHATFLDEETKPIVLKSDACVELCLSSNLLCKTVANLDDHHIRYYLKHNHPIAICTDDILPFRNSLLGEYALLLAERPLGLGLTEDEVSRIAAMSLECRFGKS